MDHKDTLNLNALKRPRITTRSMMKARSVEESSMNNLFLIH